MTPNILPFGDGAFMAEVADVRAARDLAAAAERSRAAGHAPVEDLEVLAGFGNVVARTGSGPAGDEVGAWLAELAAQAPASVHPGGAHVPDTPAQAGRVVDIPVVFDGPDLDEVARSLGMTPSRVAGLLTGSLLEVALLGFAPGFPYLIGLPPELAAVPRRPTPRPAVPAGSVAVGGGCASVYPRASPGGWVLLGRTSVRLFDPERAPFALLRPGDSVRFSVAGDTSDRAGGEGGTGTRRPVTAHGPRFVEVTEPGFLSLVEDAGRRGLAAIGVPGAGPADSASMLLANRLAGNDDDDACIEVTARGPTLCFFHAAHVAVVGPGPDGVDVALDGHRVGADLVVPVEPGQTLAVGGIRGGLRAYVAFGGGLETPLAVGSRSTDTWSGLGPGPLMAGDRLEVGLPVRPHGALSPGPPGAPEDEGPIRVLPGPDRLSAEALDSLVSAEWSVGPESNRMGLRLAGDRRIAAPAPAGSSPMVDGAVQVPPDGNPIVLMVDHATLGGYPVVACVISADLPRLGRLRPGDRVTFAEVTRAEALGAYARSARVLDGRVSGWYPTAAGT